MSSGARSRPLLWLYANDGINRQEILSKDTDPQKVLLNVSSLKEQLKCKEIKTYDKWKGYDIECPSLPEEIKKETSLEKCIYYLKI